MSQSSRVFLTLFFSILAILYILPNFRNYETTSWLPNSKINLGLDLRGGSQLLLEVDFDTFVSNQLEIISDALRKELRSNKLGYQNLVTSGNKISFTLRDINDTDSMKQIVKKIDRGLVLENNDARIKLTFSDSKLTELRTKVIDQSIEIIRMRVDPTGTTEPLISRQGDKYILLQVPGDDDPIRLKNVLGKTAKLTFHLVDESADIAEALNGRVQQGSALVKSGDAQGGEYGVVIKKKVVFSGDVLTDAQATFNNSRPAVLFSLNNVGGKIFADVTRENTGKRFAIILDGKLLSAPVINEPILGGSSVISGNFTVESANELALLLRAGALPAPLFVVEERSVGPNLGSDSIEAGKKAGMIGFVSVVIFMIWSYGVLGIFASIALSFALFYIFAALSLFHATLTLPGIAGIILTIGMAVDANVLIYERIGEEVRHGASILFSVRRGFETAFATIVDSNITTLAVAFLLYAFGAGAVKGFAVTLSIGIVASMFSATVITKLLVDSWVKYYSPKDIGLL